MSYSLSCSQCGDKFEMNTAHKCPTPRAGAALALATIHAIEAGACPKCPILEESISHGQDLLAASQQDVAKLKQYIHARGLDDNYRDWLLWDDD